MMPFYRTLGFKISLSLLLIMIPCLFVTALIIATIESTSIQKLTVDKGRIAALVGAQAYATVLENGIDSGVITLADLVKPEYEEIKYKVPVEFRRYHTKYDWYTDAHGIQLMQDRCLDASDGLFVYCSGIDRFGYVPTPHARYDHAPTGDFLIDAAQSRQKRKYEESVIQSAAMFQSSPGQATLVQEYWRKPGGKTWDVAAPIIVKGQHFGAFRVGVRADQIELHRWLFVEQLLFWFGILSAAMILFVFAMIRYSMGPLIRLSIIARALGEWTGADDDPYVNRPVPMETRDEIGGLAVCLDRVRRSLRMAKKMIEDREVTHVGPMHPRDRTRS